MLSFATEFLWSFVCVAWHLTVLVTTKRVVAAQVCNPPDVFWPLALLMRAIGRPWVFDHHDLCPELYICKTPEPKPLVTKTLAFFERMSMRCASEVISTNESYRDKALGRGGCRPERVTVVRNGPALSEVDSGPAVEDGPKRIVYLGVINIQDHVDVAVLAAACLADLRGRTGWEMVIAGDGECLGQLKEIVTREGLQDVVRFAGWLGGADVDALLRGATIGIQPDLRTDMADLSTMAKTVEYLARGLPVVAVDLRETRASAGEAAVYVPNGTPEEFAEALDALLDDETALKTMRETGLDRFRTILAWDHQAEAYLRVWHRLVPVPGEPRVPRQRGYSADAQRQPAD